MARRRSRGFVRTGPRRQTDWQFGFISSSFVTVPASSKVLLASIAGSLLDVNAPSTIIRTRGILTITSDQTGAVEEQLGAVGLTLVSDAALSVGVTAIPGPISDFGWDGWFLHQFFADENLAGSNQSRMTFELDSKAMRKYTGDDALVLMAENSHATHGLQVAIFLRILIKAG